MNLRVASVVVTFNPDDTVNNNLGFISEQCDVIFLIDNNSTDKRFLNDLPKNCRVSASQSNIGLAAALNIGILNALAEGYDVIATFDQDTLIPEDYFNRMLKGVELGEESDIAILSPMYIDRSTGIKKSFADRDLTRSLKDANFSSARSTMTSGSIMNPYAIVKCGIFLSEMFIDQLDNEICLRYRRSGYKILESKEVYVEHSVGENTSRSLFGIKMRPSNHSELRRYYIARNRIMVYKKYITYDIKWLLGDLRGFVSETLKIVLFEDKKRKKLNMTLTGIKDGLKGNTGPYKKAGK